VETWQVVHLAEDTVEGVSHLAEHASDVATKTKDAAAASMPALPSLNITDLQNLPGISLLSPKKTSNAHPSTKLAFI